MKKLNYAPELSEQLKKIIEKFQNQIKSWKKLLEELDFITISVDDYGEQTDNRKIEFHGIVGNLTFEEARNKNLIIAGMGYVSLQQFASKSFWPDSLPENDLPGFIEVYLFAGDKAEVHLNSGSGTPLFDCDKYFKEQGSFAGTWNSVMQTLFAMRKEMFDKIKLNDHLYKYD